MLFYYLKKNVAYISHVLQGKLSWRGSEYTRDSQAVRPQVQRLLHSQLTFSSGRQFVDTTGSN